MAHSKKGTSMPNTGNTAAICYRLAEPVAAELGLSLWDVRFMKEGASWYLRIFIDKKDTVVSINDCVAMSRRMDKLLDDTDPIAESYCLEVSSPGVERELTRPEHFELCKDCAVSVRLIRPLDGVREIAGILVGYQDSVITIETEEGDTKSFHKKETSGVHLIDVWDDEDDEGVTENE